MLIYLMRGWFLGLDNRDGNTTAEYIAVTFASTRLYQQPQESTLRARLTRGHGIRIQGLLHFLAGEC
jgi:hypothetical protein